MDGGGRGGRKELVGEDDGPDNQDFPDSERVEGVVGNGVEVVGVVGEWAAAKRNEGRGLNPVLGGAPWSILGTVKELPDISSFRPEEVVGKEEDKEGGAEE